MLCVSTAGSVPPPLLGRANVNAPSHHPGPQGGALIWHDMLALFRGGGGGGEGRRGADAGEGFLSNEGVSGGQE